MPQPRTLHSILALILNVALCFSLGAATATAAAPAEPPTILFTGHRLSPEHGGAAQREYLRMLVNEHGFNVAFQMIGNPGQPEDTTLDPDDYDQYHAIVFLNPAYPDWENQTLRDSFKKRWDAALEFARRGGGVLMIPGYSPPYQLSLSRCFEGLGLTAVEALPVSDRTTRATAMKLEWSYTSELASDHPVTDGVNGLWLPVYRHGRTSPHGRTMALRVNDEWNILAKFAPSVRFDASDDKGFKVTDLPRPNASDQRDRPLVMARDYGQGRLAVLAMHKGHHIAGGLMPGYERIFQSRGLNGKPSDGTRLVVNLLRWMTQTGRATPGLGGAKTQRAAIEPETFEPKPPLTEPESFDEPRGRFKGVIGALSPRSGGQASVEAFADKARAAGFDFLVVFDHLASVTEEQYAQTEQACLESSTDDFVVIPGLKMRDEVGNGVVAFRRGLHLPSGERMVTEDGRVQTLSRAPIGLLTWMQSIGHKTAITQYRDKRWLASDDPYERGVPPWDFRGYRRFHSVLTYNADGEPIDDMTEPHKVVVDDGQHPHPIALTFLDELSDLDKVIAGELPHTVYWAGKPHKTLDELASNTDEAHAYQPTSYATEGPVITRWQWDSRDMVNNGKYWDWTYYYQRWGLGVASEAGLKKIEIWDGTELIRRWPLDGQKTFEKTIVVNKHQRTMPLVIATDVNGKRAITDGLKWNSHNFRAQWIGDRFNTHSYAALPADTSPWGYTRGTYPLPSQNKGPFSGENLRLQINLDILHFPGFDGQPKGGAIIDPTPAFFSAEGEPSDGTYNRHITWPLNSHEAVVQESTVDHQLLPAQKGPNSWRSLGPLVETDVLKGRLRYTTFVHWDPHPAPVLVEAEFTFKQDVTASDHRAFRVAELQADEAHAGYRHIAIMNPAGRDHAFPINYVDQPQRQAFGDTLPHGAYVWYSPSQFGSFGLVSLTDGLRYRYDPDGKTTHIRFGEPGRTYKKGETIRWKYLTITSRYTDHGGNRTPERIVNELGIRGAPGYRVEPAQGAVVDTQYALTVRPDETDGGAFRGTITPGQHIRSEGLPATMPLIAEGLNDHWTAVLWDVQRGEMRPLPVAEGKAYAHLRELSQPRELFIGHPYVASDPAVMLTVVRTGAESLYLHAHNPTRTTKDIRITRAPGFDAMPRFTDEPEAGWRWTLEAGADRSIHLGAQTPFTPKHVRTEAPLQPALGAAPPRNGDHATEQEKMAQDAAEANPTSTQVDYDNRYEADAAPSAPSTSPRWSRRHSQGKHAVTEGVLSYVTDEGGDNQSWRIGQGKRAWGDGADAFAVGPAGSTIDFRIRVPEADNRPRDYPIEVQVRDGANVFGFRFKPTRIKMIQIGGENIEAPHDSRQFQVFRITVKDGAASLYVAGQDEPLIDKAPPTTDTTDNGLWFGDLSGGERGTARIDYIRWTNQAAHFEAPASE